MTNEQKPLGDPLADKDLDTVAGGGRELPPWQAGALRPLERIKPHGTNRGIEVPDLESDDRLV